MSRSNECVYVTQEEMDGVVKLRIPENLLREKIRTQSRFDVRFACNASDAHIKLTFWGCLQAMRKQQEEKRQVSPEQCKRTARGCKCNLTVASRLKMVVEQMIEQGRLPAAPTSLTLFLHQSPVHEIVCTMLEDLNKESPTLYSDKGALLSMVDKYYEMRKAPL